MSAAEQKKFSTTPKPKLFREKRRTENRGQKILLKRHTQEPFVKTTPHEKNCRRGIECLYDGVGSSVGCRSAVGEYMAPIARFSIGSKRIYGVHESCNNAARVGILRETRGGAKSFRKTLSLLSRNTTRTYSVPRAAAISRSRLLVQQNGLSYRRGISAFINA